MERPLRIYDQFDAILGRSRAGRKGRGKKPDGAIEAEGPFRLGLFGEFNAGKSSLANLLASSDMLPTSILSSTRIPTRLCYHPTETTITARLDNGELRSLSADEVNDLDQDEVAAIEIRLPSKLLSILEVLDTPGFSDPYHDPERTFAAAAEVQIGLWCTLATQAWRYSERLIWTGLPEHLRQTGILVVTHGDTLPTPEDRNKVMARLKRDTEGLFNKIVMISIPDALKALAADGAIIDPELWKQSGGKGLERALQASLKALLHGPKQAPSWDDEPEAAPEPDEEVEQSEEVPAEEPAAAEPMAAEPAAAEIEGAFSPQEDGEAGDEGELILTDKLGEASDDQAETEEPVESNGPKAETDEHVESGNEAEIDEPTEANETGQADETDDGADDQPQSPQGLSNVIKNAMTTIPACRLGALIDLEASRSIEMRLNHAGPTTIDPDRLASFAAGLFGSSHVQALETSYKAAENRGDDDRPFFEEVTISTVDVFYFLLRSRRRPSQAALFVVDADAKLGLAMVRSRQAMAEIDRLD